MSDSSLPRFDILYVLKLLIGVILKAIEERVL